ncbi:MAG: valine--tRNA ligase [Steroidobacteraceae bacterium]|nr:valine--tRNA ligase [Steroidobacteraceae bacterium]MBP9129488.1 valine--tRNA ligase [Steroidobacteraceae bacterium]
MDKSYSPRDIESRIYAAWEAAGWFAPVGDGTPYCIVIPPPNVTGTLHMGHAFQHTLMDVLTRLHRMDGDRTLWQPGTDHAGIATQMVVERQLAADGRTRHDLGREKFVERVWEWKEESGGTISRQMRRLGNSVDWSRDRFTMDADLSEAVLEVFVRLHEDGLIYRGKRLVNWDPVLHTALSDLEVIAEPEAGNLWHLRYPLADGSGHLIVATTRPETMLGDTAVAVNPADERYQHLVGQQVRLPLTGRLVPIIADDYCDPAFGSGCVKITPAHDFNDYEIGKRHSLPMINILTADAALNDDVPPQYRGLDRFEARQRVVTDLAAAGLLEKVDPHTLPVPRGDRSGAVLEPWLTDQWYVRIAPLAQPAIAAVEDGRIRFVPDNWSKTYFQWMRNIQDWCISRQLWWGHRIPAWYDDDGNIFVARSEAEAQVAATRQHGKPIILRQDEDVLDTWFSSALWPFSTLGWPQQTKELAVFYPTSVLVTGFDIIFFWVARMIMMGLKFREDVPFREVYITGLIRDEHGNKMSKSKGNIIDPLDLIDGIDLESLVAKRTTGLMQPQMKNAIEKATRKQFPQGIPSFGTDALRFTFAALATMGRDIRFDLGRVEGYRNFCNKLWNAARYVLMNTEEHAADIAGGPCEYSVADRWIRGRLGVAVASVRSSLAAYRFDLAAQAMYEFVWYEFCDWYLELSKPVLQAVDAAPAARRGTRRTLLEVLEGTLRMLHPLMPFITEEIWQKVGSLAGRTGRTIMQQPYPTAAEFAPDAAAERDIAALQAVVLGIRQIRGELDVPHSRATPVYVRSDKAGDAAAISALSATIRKIANLESIELVQSEAHLPPCAIAISAGRTILAPFDRLIDDVSAELARLEKRRSRTQQERDKCAAKLANANFVANAPESVVMQERDRIAEFERQLDQLDEQMRRLAALATPAGG